jgi:hypothetical protein
VADGKLLRDADKKHRAAIKDLTDERRQLYRQVRRALRTWAERFGTVSWARALDTARKVLGVIDHPQASGTDREALVDLIARAGYSGEVDQAELARLAKRVSDPNDSGLTRGPGGITTSDDYVRTVVAREAAVRDLEKLPTVVYNPVPISEPGSGPL